MKVPPTIRKLLSEQEVAELEGTGPQTTAEDAAMEEAQSPPSQGTQAAVAGMGQAVEQVIAQAPREGSSRGPALEPVPLAQATQTIAETVTPVKALAVEANGRAVGAGDQREVQATVVTRN